MSVQIVRLESDHPLWPELVAHLRRSDQLRHVSDSQGPIRRYYYLGAVECGQVVGHLAFCRQGLLIPSDPSVQVTLLGAELYECYVQTFYVEEAHRRRGIGSALQTAAVDWSRQLGCHQLRSWSSADKLANYALKLGLGFAFCPGVYVVPTTGQRISGGWFVKQLSAGADTSAGSGSACQR